MMRVLFLFFFCFFGNALADELPALYVGDFKEDGKVSRLALEIASDLEMVIVNSKCCYVLDRKGFNDVKSQVESENGILNKDSRSYAVGAQGFINGHLIRDKNNGYEVRVKLIDMQGVIISNAKVEMSYSDFSDRSYREKKILDLANGILAVFNVDLSNDFLEINESLTKKEIILGRPLIRSAKLVANEAYLNGNYPKDYWWSLVCQSIDKVYYDEIIKVEPDSRSSMAITNYQKRLWSSIFRETVDDIYMDEIKKGSRGMTKASIRKKILKSDCPV